MHKIILLASLIALSNAGISDITKTNVELFKYSPNDVFTLPEDIDDDKPPVIFNGEVMKAKTELFENLNSGKKFKLQLKTQNGIDIQSVGKLKDGKTFVVSGQYSFTGADGKRYKTRYTADEFGYHPMTELDLDIPEPIPAAAPKQNTFKFLNQNLNFGNFGQPKPAINGYPLRGSGQSGDDYSLRRENYADHGLSGYDYPVPSRQYLPLPLGEPDGSIEYSVPASI